MFHQISGYLGAVNSACGKRVLGLIVFGIKEPLGICWNGLLMLSTMEIGLGIIEN